MKVKWVNLMFGLIVESDLEFCSALFSVKSEARRLERALSDVGHGLLGNRLKLLLSN